MSSLRAATAFRSTRPLSAIATRPALHAKDVAAMKADFERRATAPFKKLKIPGRAVLHSEKLPAAVKKALGQKREAAADASWETISVKKATLAGHSVFIVHYDDLDDGNMDAEKVRIFTATGTLIAHGSCFDGMGGFTW